MSMSIRIARNDDSKIISDIAKVVFSSSLNQHCSEKGYQDFLSFASAETIKVRMSKTGSTYGLPNKFFIIENLKQPVGVIELEDGYNIKMFYVIPQFQGSGMGKQLFEFVLSHSIKNFFETNHLYVNAPLPSIGFFSKLGFQIAVPDMFTCPDIGQYQPMKYLYGKNI
jgi:N-acetylglutamate synthase-like GNAT family acetyltransferase